MKRLFSFLIAIAFIVLLGCAAPAPAAPTLQEMSASPVITLSPSPALTPVPSPSSDLLDSDFFLSVSIDDFRRFLFSYNFDELSSMCDDYYISNPYPSSSDSINVIAPVISEASSIMRYCAVVHDDFDNSYTVCDKEVLGIDKNICVFPWCDRGYYYVRIGFISREWLFFNNFKIKVSDDDFVGTFLGSSSVVREIIGSEIIEYMDDTFSDEEVESICVSESPVVRFYGDNNKTLDHSLSVHELRSLRNLRRIATITRMLDDLSYQWTYKK